MGITSTSFKFERELFESLNISYKNLELCELGNQKLSFKKLTGKQYYTSLGVKHTSIDLNNKDGALPLNLDLPLPASFLNKFRVVTDYGTSEHVNNQYSVFKNVHDICKNGGVMIHVLPSINSPQGRSERYYYSRDFMKELARKCKYKIVDLTAYKDDPTACNSSEAIRAVFMKTKDNPFISKKEFYSIKGLKDSGNMLYTGNYEKNILPWVIWYIRVLKNPRNIKRKFSQMFFKNK